MSQYTSNMYVCIVCGTIKVNLLWIIGSIHVTCRLGVKPLIHQSELGTYTKVVPFQEKCSFHFVVL